ncbi:bromodomain-containing protein 8-like [Hydractinia symbiolongicarpus]|uniref:bromodomain-containing protein 8-like n=1 Tax=Hydractinia symbiolongicarpus TaxID=13093 RepID=UPI00254D12E8|nr:bromodomain-containing protein 8-like [Hydractinia symbiolongicarpus]
MAANELDDWSTKEKFVLACCVTRSGDQNWVSVSRTMRLILEACEEEKKRPAEWFSQKNFAIKYNELLNTASVAKRKVRGASSESGNVETPAEQILRKLTFERIEELDRVIKAERERYKKLKSDIHKIQSGKLDDELPRILQAMQSDENVQLEQLIKEDPTLEELSVKTTLQAASAVSSSPASQNTPSRPQRAAKETEKFKSYIEQRQKHNAKYHHNPTTTSTSTAVTSTVVSSSVSSNITTSADVSLFATTVGPSPAQVQNMTVKHDSMGSIVQPRGLLITKPEQQQQNVNVSVPSTPVRTAAAEAKEKSFLSNLLSSPASEIKAQAQHINNTLKVGFFVV